jgi:hypothetical protein
MPNFEELYRTYTETELMDAFSTRHQYTPEARAAMMLVINERGLSEAAEKEIARQHAAEAAAHSLALKQFEEKMLGEHIPAKEYAKKHLVNGEYMSGKMTGSKFRVLNVLLVSFSIATAVLAVISMIDRPPFHYAVEISISATVAMLAIVLYLSQKTKANYRFFRPDSKDVFEVVEGGYSFTGTLPLNYFVCWDTIKLKRGVLTITHTIATLCITNKENETIALVANLGIQSPSPDWPHAKEVVIPKKTKFFHEIVTQRIHVVKIKKILDGLQGEGGELLIN